MNDREIFRKVVTITDVNIKPVGDSMVYIISTDQGKYEFWDKKKSDGTDTKAMEQWKKFNFRKGDTVEVAYTERESTKINEHTGRPYKNYTIMFFVTQDENTPASHTASQGNQAQTTTPQATQTPSGTGKSIEQQLEDIRKDIRMIKEFCQIPDDKDDIRIEDVPF